MIEGYEQLYNGVIKQINTNPYTYDKEYIIKTYDKMYGVLCDMISYLRLGYIIGNLKKNPKNVLDIGYGNGSFLKICQNASIKTFGTDISGYNLMHGKFIEFNEILNNKFDLITMFDSIEHFNNLDFLDDLQCEHICISTPYCQYNSISKTSEINADNYFLNWKHRKIDEHIWYFDENSLTNFMKEKGFKLISSNNIEDIIRKPVNGNPNILTCIFKKIK